MPAFLHEICYLILVFILFSIAGWCMEVTLKFIQFHRFINRGFLIGPYCPIYGGGAVLVTLAVGGLVGMDNSYGTTFMVSFIVCGALEYFVSLYLEKVFHARWWDYSSKPMNLNGRIWIGNLILFGIGGTAIVKWIVPFLYRIFDNIPENILLGVSICVVIVIATDYTVSHFIMKLVKVSAENSKADDTETISKEIYDLLRNKSALHRRIAEAYPNVTFQTDRITQKMREEKDRLQTETKKIRTEITDRLSSEKSKLYSEHEDLSAAKDELIAGQDQLIAMLENPEKADPAAIASQKALLDQKREVIAQRELTILDKKKALIHKETDLKEELKNKLARVEKLVHMRQ